MHNFYILGLFVIGAVLFWVGYDLGFLRGKIVSMRYAIEKIEILKEDISSILSTEEVYAEGYEAFLDGTDESSCPYEKYTGARGACLAGWDEAVEDSVNP